MNDLNNKMWRESSEGKRKTASLSAQTPAQQGSPAGGDRATSGQGSPAGGGGATGEEGAATGGEGGRPEQSSGVGGSSPDTEGEAPPHWMHVNLLNFALFGPLSHQNDADLSLVPSDGPTRKTSPVAGSPETVEATSGSESPVPGIENSGCMKLLAPANVKMSRRDIKKAQQATVKIEDGGDRKRKMAETQSEEMVMTMREMRESIKRKARRAAHSDLIRSIRDGNNQRQKDHDRRIKRLKARLAFATDHNDEKARAEAYVKLKEALRTDVDVHEVPGPFVESNDADRSANTNPTTAATPGPSLLTASPPLIGSVNAPIAQLADDSSEMATATTSSQCVTGSAGSGHSSPSRVGGPLSPGRAPSPGVADREPGITATTSGEGMAGPTVPGHSTPSGVGGYLHPAQHPPLRGEGQLPPGWSPCPVPAAPAGIIGHFTPAERAAWSAVPVQHQAFLRGRGQLPQGLAPTPAPAAPAPATAATASWERMAEAAVPAQYPPFSGGTQVGPGWTPPNPLGAPGTATTATRYQPVASESPISIDSPASNTGRAQSACSDVAHPTRLKLPGFPGYQGESRVI